MASAIALAISPSRRQVSAIELRAKQRAAAYELKCGLHWMHSLAGFFRTLKSVHEFSYLNTTTCSTLSQSVSQPSHFRFGSITHVFMNTLFCKQILYFHGLYQCCQLSAIPRRFSTYTAKHRAVWLHVSHMNAMDQQLARLHIPVSAQQNYLEKRSRLCHPSI